MNTKNLLKNLLVFLAIFLVIAMFFSFAQKEKESVEIIGLQELVNQINNGEIESILVDKNDLKIILNNGEEQIAKKEPGQSLSELLSNFGVDSDKMTALKIEIKGESKSDVWFTLVLPFLLPVILIIAIFFFMMRGVQGANSKAMMFGQSQAREVSKDKDKKTTFADVAGAKEAKEELEEVVEFLREPKKFTNLGARIPRGVLLLGAPGTGKTLLAKAVAGEAKVPYYIISGSEFVEMFVGVGASVTGDTPILIKTKTGAKLLPIAEFVDQYYQPQETDVIKPIIGEAQTLGWQAETNGFRGSYSGDKKFFGSSQWSRVSGVYRHKADKIYEIYYLGGLLKTTGDHSVFVRVHNMIQAKRADELRPGDILVNLPFKVRSKFIPGIGTTHKVKAHIFPKTTNLMLDLYEMKLALTQKQYAYAMTSRETVAQSVVASQIGVSQSTVKNWQLGRHQPQFLNSTVVTAKTPVQIPVTEELMRLLGYYLAEGRTEEYYTQFIFGLHEKDLQADCVKLIKKIFGLTARVNDITETNSCRITVGSAVVSDFFNRHCNTGSHNKCLPEFVWELPRQHFLALLDGYSKGDGYTTQDGKLSVTSVSHQLICELTWLCHMHGLQVGVREAVMPAGRIIRNKPLPETKYWSLIIGKTSHPFVAKVKSAYQWKKPIVKKIVQRPYNDYVYDLCGCDNEAFFGGEKPILLHNSRVRDLFKKAKKNAPCIVFIDEIDAVGRRRGAGLGGSHDEREQTLNQILVEMDGFDPHAGVIVISATNRPDVLDPALLRPGRFDRQVIIDMPDIQDREDILKIHSKGKPLAKEVVLRRVAERTPGFSGADLANVLNEAAILAARKNTNEIANEHLFNAIEKVMLGPERKSRILSEEEKKITAYHEAGHALVAHYLPHTDPVHKISIIARGQAGGYTLKLPIQDRHMHTKTEFIEEIAVLLGGYLTEQEVFNQITTGATSDLRQATHVARKLITDYGMSDNLGPRTFGEKEEMIFLGREIHEQRDYSEKIAEKIDNEIFEFMEQGMKLARGIIKEKRDKLEDIVKVLLDKETIEKEEFEQIMNKKKIEKK
ncbi:MAG: AAA family ATPase [bacterium]